tara:strand:- start:838 stop:1194 length:357 start_codon:yes stop_codon:yes gene_type:complete
MVEFNSTTKTQVSSDRAFGIIKSMKFGQWFSGTYIKKDGEIRKFNGRLGVTKHLKGGELKYNASERGNIIYWDTIRQSYRTINTKSLIDLRVSKQDYLVVSDGLVKLVQDIIELQATT